VVICVVFALLTAVANGTASVLQRRAAANAPSSEALRLSLIRDLMHQKVWLGGIAMTIVAAVCQAVALATGPIAVVQPIFVVELPTTLLLAGYVFHRSISGRTWIGVAMIAVGLAAAMAVAAPGGGGESVHYAWIWLPTLVVTLGFEFLVVSAALRGDSRTRAALLALGAACGYALTAALMKDAMAVLDEGRGAAALFSSWQLYATAAAGVGALFLLQNALQAGSLAISQPVLSLGDPVISVAYGVTLFGETIRTGWWLVPELLAMAVIAAGCVLLARSPLAAVIAPDEEQGAEDTAAG
jgi:drug/metabolite transporter (DMT)-like permease